MSRLSDEHQAIEQLAERVFAARPEEPDAGAAVWDAATQSGLLSLALPHDLDGSELGMADLCVVMYHAGRSLSREPLWQSVCATALPLARFGRPATDDLLGGVAVGKVRVGAALVEGTLGEWEDPTTTVTPAGNGWVVNGVKTFVDVPERATHLVIAAVDGEGRSTLVLVDPKDPRLRLRYAEVTDGRRVATVQLHDARALLPPVRDGDGAEDVLLWTVRRVIVALCAYHAGIARTALELTAQHLRTREQFGRPLGSFQAVAMRSADAYMDTDAMWATTWAAAGALDLAGDDVAERVAVAGICGKTAGARVLASAQHLHGGLGVDTTYPLHRYFLASKRAQLAFGSAAALLHAFGTELVRQQRQETR